MICHEHLEYYRLKQIKWMTDIAGFKIIDIEFNDVNGGSISITAAKNASGFCEDKTKIERVLAAEKKAKLDTSEPYIKFKDRVFKHKERLSKFVKDANKIGKKIFGYGASTKGNVLLQFACFTDRDIPFIAEVNKDKFGRYTPGTLIPIVSEKKAKSLRPDYFLVLPWHFKNAIIEREKKYLKKGGRLLMPLPDVAVI